VANWKMEVRGFRELQASFRDAPRKIQNLGRQWAKDVAADEVKYVRKAAPGKTGKFRRTIQPYSRAFVIGVQFLPYPKLGQNLRKWIVGGTRPHIIRARHAKALRFVWRGRMRYYKWVRHPGTKPNDFITRGAKSFNPRVQYWLRELERRIVKAMGAK
jgi:hypothetical protein